MNEYYVICDDPSLGNDRCYWNGKRWIPALGECIVFDSQTRAERALDILLILGRIICGSIVKLTESEAAFIRDNENEDPPEIDVDDFTDDLTQDEETS